MLEAMSVVAPISCDLEASASLLIESSESSTKRVEDFLFVALHEPHAPFAQLNKSVRRQFVQTDAGDEKLPQCFSLR